jgi:hypothetical protein
LHGLSDALPLLPKPVADLFVKIAGAKWRLFPFPLFFLRSFVIPMGIEWMSGCAPFALKFVKTTLEFIQSDSDCHQFLNDLFHTNFLSIELPYLYAPFGVFFVEYFVSLHDIRLLGKVLQASGELPETVVADTILKVPIQYDFCWYDCLIYPHRRHLWKPLGVRLFDSDSAEFQALEKLVDFHLNIEKLREFLSILQKHEDLATAWQITELVAQPSDSFPKRFSEIMEIVKIPRMAKRVWLNLVQANLNRWTEVLLPVLKHLNDQFGRLGCSQTEFDELRVSLRESSQKLLNQVLNKLNTLELLSVADQFQVIMTSMNALFQLQTIEKQSDSMYGIVIRKLSTGYILSTYIVLSSFAMRIPVFADLCTDAENCSWLKLESVILLALNKDAVFLQAFINLQETFTQFAKRDIQGG